MSRRFTIILAIVGVLAAAWIGYAKILVPAYFAPRRELLNQIDAASAKLSGYAKNLQDHPRVLKDLQKYVDRTLGGDLESVDDRLRTRLNRLGEQVHFKVPPTVNTTSSAKPRESPAKVVFTGANRALGAEIDFYELEGWISGSGTYQQVLTLIDLIEAEPWIKRIDQLKLDPKDNGDRFNFTVRLTTIFLPKSVPNPDAAVSKPLDPERYAALTRINPFKVPPAPAKGNQPAVASGPAAFPYDQWDLTGIAQGPAGAEIWLLNRQSRESRRLVIGETFQEFVLVSAQNETAEFLLGDKRFAVTVGQHLSDRTPLSQ